MERPKVGTALCILRGDRVLMGRRRNATHGNGTYSFPGGHLEHGEPVLLSLLREVREEAGPHLEFSHPRLWCVTNETYPEQGLHYVTLVFVADHMGGDAVLMEPDKCDGWWWYGWNDLPSPLMGPLAAMVKADCDPRRLLETRLVDSVQ